ncbi:oligosaccharide flippase family protein [Telmatospirillum sp.]|uniref:lipopolysaccharide biosynthesis protein n=1 Tax=Telmatospirillum sp. TaxID=2079197 RepID=UPI002847E762|nr:oligosaccharide flippase family protein [Telmatospirillum sp.]MDR3434982.1 oligosaccharide flippase family protein [Telmatospirillum sp.]
MAFARGRVRWLQDWLIRRPFLRNVSIMLGGAAGGQMVSIVLSPVLTRLYSPQQFGVLSVYSAILAILVVVASLRYELALPLVRSDEDAINLMAVCLCVLLATTAVVGLGAFAFPDRLLDSLWPNPVNSIHVASYRGLLILGYACLGAYFIALYVATRAGAFHSIAKTRFGQGVVGPVSQIGLAMLGGSTPGLLVGSILGQSAGTFGLFFAVIPDRHALVRALSWQRMADMARRYSRFPLIASWAALIDAIGSNQLLYLLISVQYSARIAGFIFLVERIVSRPLAIIGTSILQVFVGEAGQTVSSDPAKLKSRFYQVVLRQFVLAVAWVVITNVAGAMLFPFVFGAEWTEGIVYLQAMSLGYLALAIVQPVFHTLQILEKQSLAAAWQIGRLLLTAGTFELGAALGYDAPWVIAGYGAAQAVACIVLLLLMAHSIQQLQKVRP